MKTTNKKYLLCISISALCATLAGGANAENACHYIEQANLAITHPDKSRQPVVPGAINGKPVQMEINTGTTNTFILRAEADKQNMNPERLPRQVQSAAGAESMFLVKIKDFAIGNAHTTNLRFPVIESIGKADRAALVGDDFLLQYDVELNFPEKNMKLFNAEHCNEKALAYWDANAMTVPMEFTPGFARPLVQVKINGAPIWAMISTGSTYSTVDLEAARRLGLSTDAPGVVYHGKTNGVGDEKMERWNMTFDSFAIGDETVQHPRLVVMESTYRYRGRKPYEMVLGRDFLSAHRVLLAQSQMRFYYSYNGGQVFLKDEPARSVVRAAP